MMWTKSLIKSICILFLFSTTIFAATDLVNEHHRRLLQDYGDVPEEDHHSHISNIFKSFTLLNYITFVFVVIIILLLVYFCLFRSKKNESSPQPQPHQNTSVDNQ